MNDEMIIEGTWWRMKDGSVGYIDKYEKDQGLIVFKYRPSFFSHNPSNNVTKIFPIDEFLNNKFIILCSYENITQGSLWEMDKTLVKVFDFNNGMIKFIDIDTGICHNIGREIFLQSSVYIKPDDLNAIYIRRTNDNDWVRIIDAKHNYCVYYHHSGGEFNGKDDKNDVESFHKQYKLITLYPSVKDNDNFIKKSSIPDYKKFFNKTNEGNDNMNNDNRLKTDKSKLEDFGTGAKREDKTGKGRYDLIPGDVMSDFEDFVWCSYFENGNTTCSSTDVSKSAYFEDWQNVELYYDFIFNMISYFFIPKDDRIECCDDNGELSYEVTWDLFRKGIYDMRKALAKHYEAGAEIHGVDNWKKGLPVYGSARGGCFLDSMRRHTDQALSGATDEPHAIAAIWNAFGAIWTLKHRPHCAMYQNASAVKAEEKPKSTHFDMVDSVIDALKYMSKNKSKDFEEKCNEVLNGRYLTSINHPKHIDNDNDHFSVAEVTAPSGKKYKITKWPEGFDIILKNIEVRKEIMNQDINHPIGNVINDIINITREVNMTDLTKRIENYHDTKYNIKKILDVLKKIIDSKNFSRRTLLVRQVYFDIYAALVILNDIIACFYEYGYDMIRIKKIVSDVQDMINHNVGGIRECCGNITLKWESCPKCKYGYIVCLAEPDEHKFNILYEIIGRAAHGLLSRDTGGYDPFCGLAITQSLLEFNTFCLEERVYKK